MKTGGTLTGLAVLGAVFLLGPKLKRAQDTTDLDVEAAARMIASEDPSAPEVVHVEQIHTQLRAKRPWQTLYERITGGAGWGPQNKQRPVSTAQPATDKQRALAKRVLAGEVRSTLDRARRFFNPAAQDSILRMISQARDNNVRTGAPIPAQVQRLIDQGYRRTADEVRVKWTSEGSRFVGKLGPVEFWT